MSKEFPFFEDELYSRIWNPEESDPAFETITALFDMVFNRDLNLTERKVLHLRFWQRAEWSDIASAVSMTERNLHYVRDRAYSKLKNSPIIQAVAKSLNSDIDLSTFVPASASSNCPEPRSEQ